MDLIEKILTFIARIIGIFMPQEPVIIPKDITIIPPIIQPIEPIEPIKKTYLDEIKNFLKQDTISNMDYGLGEYQCTQFSRDLSRNANEANIPIGGIILGNKPDLSGYSNHALNYIIIDGIFYIINPESDFIIPWSEYIHRNRYKYYKIYPNGELLPTRWIGGLDLTGSTSDLL